MIIQRYILREISSTFVGVALLLFLVVFSVTFIRVMSDVLENRFPVSIMLQLLLLKSSANLVFILPLMFFLAVLLALGRLYRDSEITVLFACGFGPERLYRSVGFASLLLALVFGGLSLFYVPWNNERDVRLQDEARAHSLIEGLAAGRFNALGEDFLVYLERISADRKEMYEVFAHGEVAGQSQVLAAARAHQQTVDGVTYLVFYDGYRYEGEPVDADFRIIQFREHGVRLHEREVVASERPRKALSSLALWRGGEPRHAAELQWRLAVPVSTLVLGLLAVPLSRSSPRDGRYARLVEALLLYILYSQLMFMAKSALHKGSLPSWLGIWWVHVLMFGLLLLLASRQLRLPRLRKLRSS